MPSALPRGDPESKFDPKTTREHSRNGYRKEKPNLARAIEHEAGFDGRAEEGICTGEGTYP